MASGRGDAVGERTLVIRRSLMLTGPRRLEWIREPLRFPDPGAIAVRTLTGAVSLGTEMPYYEGSNRAGVAYPRMTGYENVGEVIAVGAGVAGLAPGDRVLASYGHRSHAVLPVDQATRIPAGTPDALALLAILSCDAAKGVLKSGARPGESVLVTGAGTIGLLTLFNLLEQGIEQVDVVEPVEHRRGLAMALRARAAFGPEAPAAEGYYDAGIECSSRNDAFCLLQAAVRREGTIAITADGNVEPLVLQPLFHAKELRVVASSDGIDYPGHARLFFDAAERKQEALLALFELEVEAAGLAEAFRQIADGEVQRPVKLLVHY